MSLENYRLEYEYENKASRRAKNPKSQTYKAERASRLGSMVREMGRSIKSNIIRRITKNKGV